MAKAKKEVEEVEKEDARLCVYEVGYHMVPTIAEENLGEEVTLFKDFFIDNGVIFISDEYPKMLELAYEMTRSIANKKQKFSYSYFGWVKFECTTDQAKMIKEALDKNEKIIRYLMIKTVRENTMSVKKTYGRGDSKRNNSSRVTVEEKAPINEETIDEEIDALVV